MIFTRKTLRLLLLPLLVSFTMASRCISPEERLEMIQGTGKKAMDYTRAMIAFGPRPSGSEALAQTRAWIRSQVEADEFEYQEEAFSAVTPVGEVEMKNLRFLIPGKKATERVVLVAHYETKLFENIEFVGANDATSSVALLLALSPSIRDLELPYDVEILLVDGEEAFVSWSDSDSLYGSRHYVDQMNELAYPKAAVVVDMVGDRDLQFIRNRLMSDEYLIWLGEILEAMGRGKLLASNASAVVDDQVPFLEKDIPTLHLMDFTFGGKQSPGIYWHTEDDTIDKISAESLQIAGEVLVRFLLRLAD